MIRSQSLYDMTFEEAKEALDGILSAIAFGMRATVHTTTRATPSQLIFGRDAMLNVRFQADWKYISDRKTRLIKQNNERENKTRIPHEYKVDDLVTVKEDHSRKHAGSLYAGPYRIIRVHDNGTVTLSQDTNRGGVVTQRWNIRNIFPYKA